MGSWNRYDADQEMQPLAQEGTPTASCQGLWPIRFLISPRMETSQPSWATCASAQLPSQEQSVSGCLDEASCISACALCLRSCLWAPLKGTGSPCTFKYVHALVRSPELPALQKKVLSNSFIFFMVGLSLPCPCLFYWVVLNGGAISFKNKIMPNSNWFPDLAC